MDQGVIENLKRLYRKQLLRHLLLSEDQSVQSVLDFYRKMTLKDCCYMIADSWSSIKQFTLRNSWNNILDHRQLNATPGLSDAGEEMEELLEALKAVSLSGECENADVEIRLACDSDDPGFQILDDDEVVESILNVEDEMDEDLDEDDLIDYVERTYVTGRRGRPPIFPPEVWNVYRATLNDQHRTNNAVEGWHNKFQKLMVVHHPSIWKFIEVLKDEQEDNEQVITQILGGHRQIRPSVPRRYLLSQMRIVEVVRNYATYKANSQMDVYLKAIACHLKYNPPEQDDEEHQDYNRST
ncbi:hypothetical protein M514_21545 [Trichuris suis]|uniref:DDE-1 domain-containing protein n=1 Tax=Trichuris suis TaxID=68888 RepID=A0A085N9W2_9BILA|nr:hypothetical protein M514_21545 [Trichuris suis]